MRMVAGIDPGKTGGCAIFSIKGELVSAFPLIMDNPGDLCERLRKFGVDEILIERAQPAAGDAGQFEYGRSFGRTEAAAMLAIGAPLHYCSSVWWKARLNVPVDKKAAYWKAVDRWPRLQWLAPPGPRGGLDAVHGIAEAAFMGSVLCSSVLYTQLITNNAARVRKTENKRRRPKFQWRGD